ncbi:class I SAM-dependent methyltransferase [Glycomyces tritici]|uniref:Class I SAM-dependent methyltransferase n=1 Tax=Glycomyces tritici TaxID=2665176 RepID=A0ABT7YX29_9ACTN|nr:class I SAM-dependent methyltransferase [Glycomyces tritici]MDN3243173.1 class I SAM-dependent methyltransferase [Glycomyces tritici]
MKEKPWYETSFDEFYLDLDKFAHSPEGSRKEASDAIALLGIRERSSVLDLCCGQGRHSIAIAEFGHEVRGLDLSKRMLDAARAHQLAAGVDVTWIHADMRDIPAGLELDAVLSLYQSFGYLEHRNDDLEVLKAIRAALATDGRLLLQVPNRDAVAKDFWQSRFTLLPDGSHLGEVRQFDPASGWLRLTMTIFRDGSSQRREFRIRLYNASEIEQMLISAGLRLVQVSASLSGAAFNLDSDRMVVVASKVT